MRLRFTRQAKQDLESIADYVHAFDPKAALRVRGAILDSLQILVRFPRIGRRQSIEGVRKLTTRRYLHVVYYMVDDAADEVVVLTIQHPARERPYSDR